MPEYLTLKDGRKIELLSDEEDRRVTDAALKDPDALPLTEEDWEQIKQLGRFGNPMKNHTKVESK
ncbi:hypothetical protein ABT364_22085 [Massilia sp. SR12]